MVFLKEELLAGAGLVQGCADGMAQLAAAGDKEEMLQCYWDRIDFCLAKNFPTKEYLKEHFDGMLHERGIYIDERVEIAGGNAVLLGACEAECGVEKYAVSRLADYAVLPVGEKLIYATHGHVHNLKNLPPLAPGDVLLHGHTHIPAWTEFGEGNLYLNPGSVSIPKEGSAHSYMTLEGETFLWKTLEGEVYRELEL